MVSTIELIDFKNPVFMAYAFWSTVLALKMMYLSVHTAIFRFKNQVRPLICEPITISFQFFYVQLMAIFSFKCVSHSPIQKMLVNEVFVSMSKRWNGFDGKQQFLNLISFFSFFSSKPIRIENEINLIYFRAHRNDMENILPSFLIGLLYVLINPSPAIAPLLFKVAAFARILHTFVYAIVVVPQPARALAFFVHYTITIYMGISILMHLF